MAGYAVWKKRTSLIRHLLQCIPDFSKEHNCLSPFHFAPNVWGNCECTRKGNRRIQDFFPVERKTTERRQEQSNGSRGDLHSTANNLMIQPQLRSRIPDSDGDQILKEAD